MVSKEECRNGRCDFDGVGAPWLCLLCLLLLSGHDEQHFGAGCRPASGNFGFPVIWSREVLGKQTFCFDGRPLWDQPPNLDTRKLSNFLMTVGVVVRSTCGCHVHPHMSRPRHAIRSRSPSSQTTLSVVCLGQYIHSEDPQRSPPGPYWEPEPGPEPPEGRSALWPVSLAVAPGPTPAPGHERQYFQFTSPCRPGPCPALAPPCPLRFAIITIDLHQL